MLLACARICQSGREAWSEFARAEMRLRQAREAAGTWTLRPEPAQALRSAMAGDHVSIIKILITRAVCLERFLATLSEDVSGIRHRT
jgi:hypothetical protein